MLHRLLYIAACVVVSLLLFSCGGGRGMPYSEDPGVSPGPPMEAFAYVPFVEQVTIPDVIRAGQTFEVEFKIQTRGLPETTLHILDTSSEPITADGAQASAGGLALYLEPLSVATIPYDGSGRITFHFLIASPGEYELVYRAAASLGDAGVYELGDPKIGGHTSVFRVPFVAEE